MEMWQLALLVVSLFALVRLGLARRAVSVLRSMISRTGILLFALAVLSIGGSAVVSVDAAEVASGGVSDRVRCSTASPTTLSAGTNSIIGKCYVSLSTGRFDAGSSTLLGGSNDYFQLPYRVAAGGSGITSTGLSGCARGTLYTGPTSVPGMGDIPTGAAVFIGSTCTLGALSGTTGLNLAGAPAFGPRPPLASVHCGTPSDAACHSATGSTWGYDWHGLSTLTALPWPADWFPGGAMATPTLNFCGASVTTLPSSGVVSEGDSVEFTLSVKQPGVAGTISVEWNPDEWVTVFAAEALVGATVTLTVPDIGGWIGGTSLSSVRLRCTHLTAGGFRYMNIGDGDGAVVETVRACAASKLFRPDVTTMLNGTAYTFTVQRIGTVAGTIDVEYHIYDPEYLHYAMDPAADTWTLPAAWNDVGVTQGTDVSITALYFGPARQVAFRCTDALGVYELGSFKTPLRLAGGGTIGDGNGVDGCYDQDYGWNPLDWVPAAGRMWSCLVVELVEPDWEFITAEWNALFEQAETNVPLAWVHGGYEVVSDASAGLSGAVSASSTACIQMIPAGGDLVTSDPGSVCPSAMGVSSFEAMRPWLGVAVWLGWAWSMYGAIFRKSPASTEPEQLTLF